MVLVLRVELEDLAEAAAILKGHKIKDGLQLIVVPTSSEIMAKAASMGYLETLAEAGAFISSATCDYCFGRNPITASGETAISTGTLNVAGRMGSTESKIYLASAATVAATALKGEITDPRELIMEKGRI
ncbi:aconitase family protein [Peribacillus butanolivorans]|uniref:aconitase family protein n=1 Tax=Peribacillus butanolivorans TaxID=421767 RepID=UPI0036467674